MVESESQNYLPNQNEIELKMKMRLDHTLNEIKIEILRMLDSKVGLDRYKGEMAEKLSVKEYVQEQRKRSSPPITKFSNSINTASLSSYLPPNIVYSIDNTVLSHKHTASKTKQIKTPVSKGTIKSFLPSLSSKLKMIYILSLL